MLLSHHPTLCLRLMAFDFEDTVQTSWCRRWSRTQMFVASIVRWQTNDICDSICNRPRPKLWGWPGHFDVTRSSNTTFMYQYDWLIRCSLALDSDAGC